MSSLSLHSDKTRRGRLLIGLASVGLILIFPLFFIGGPGWSDGPLIRAAWNLGHPLFFALLTLTSQPWRFLHGWKLWAATSAIVLVLGLGIEFAQSFDNRDVDGRDVFRNLTGLWIVLALRSSAGFRKPHAVRDRLIRALAAGLLAIDLFAVSRIAVQQIQVSQLPPALYDFQQNHPERFWRGNVARVSGDQCGSLAENPLSISLTTRRYSGASLDNLPSDWRGYDGLEIELWNPQSVVLQVTLRINDLAHEKGNNHYYDRFNRTFRISPGTNQIQQSLSDVTNAPKGRQMNMEDIRRLMLFTSNLSQPGRLCLSKLRLTRNGDDQNGLE